ncbi:NIPSNAP-domain-containing protein [Neoconidiobolus thromboides FSU 785]|nr:NIPSNAP-domain-containing protein [Neoconidiobolus thromboides FSU 785]
MLARGKYVHQIEMHHIKPEAQEDYAKLLGSFYPKHLKNYGNEGLKLCGSWLSEIGELDKAVHIWEYDGYAAYDKINAKLAEDSNYQSYQKELRPMLNKRENQFCLEFAFWATSAPKFHGGIYELRSYLLKPGRLLEWEQNWKVGLECRRQFTEPVGAWFSQLGDLNYVHHMWVYPNLQQRKATREEAWKVDGWSETVYNTVRLIERMQSTILVPMDHSPLK